MKSAPTLLPPAGLVFTTLRHFDRSVGALEVAALFFARASVQGAKPGHQQHEQAADRNRDQDHGDALR